MVRLRVERQRLGPRHVRRFCSTTKLVGLFSLMTVNVPSRCELKASIVFGLNVGAVDAVADWQSGDDFAVVGIENHHRLRIVAGGEKDVILGVKREPAGTAALAAEIVMSRSP